MLYVILKDGRVLKYNLATWCVSQDDHFLLRTKENGDWIADIMKSEVERIDAQKPCAILKEVRDRKRMKIY